MIEITFNNIKMRDVLKECNQHQLVRWVNNHTNIDISVYTLTKLKLGGNPTVKKLGAILAAVNNQLKSSYLLDDFLDRH